MLLYITLIIQFALVQMSYMHRILNQNTAQVFLYLNDSRPFYISIIQLRKRVKIRYLIRYIHETSEL